MIVLYRRSGSSAGDEVQESLKELVLAHQVVEVETGTIRGEPLPVLAEGDDIYAGEAIAAFLERRRRRLRISRSMSADACFIDPDDPDHCI